jgi:anthranilate 1,2-dioxygenase large subunit
MNDRQAPRWPAAVNEIPKSVFTDPALYEREIETIFHGPQWHALAHRAELPAPGDFKTMTLGRMPTIVSHGEDGRIRVFLNSCTHRGNQVEAASCGNRKGFECPYHRWMFKTTGELAGCPGSEEFGPGFDKRDYGLRELRTAEFCGLIFASASAETPPLDDWLGGVSKALAGALGGDASNWKAYSDNDGYHAPLLHMGFRLLQWQGGKGSQMPTPNGHLAFESVLKPVSNRDFLKDPSLIDFKGENPETGSRIAQLFPQTVITKHMDVINVRFATPIDVACTEVHYAYFAHADDSEELVRHRIRQSSNLLGPCGMVSMEDASIFQRIHLGCQTPGNAAFQKGVKRFDEVSYEVKQNDESGNLPKWDYYRRVMGFERDITGQAHAR